MLHYRVQVHLPLISRLIGGITLSRCGTREDAMNAYYRWAENPVVAALHLSGRLRCEPPTPYTAQV